MKAERKLRVLPKAGIQGMARGTSAAPWKGLREERMKGMETGKPQADY